MRGALAALVAGGLALPAATAHAQAYQCRVPSTAVTVPRIAPGGTLVFSLDSNGCELEIHNLPGAAGKAPPREGGERR